MKKQSSPPSRRHAARAAPRRANDRAHQSHRDRGRQPVNARGPSLPVEGILELHPDGYGFLRNPAKDCLPTATDAYVPAQLIRQLALLPGDWIVGEAEAGAQRRGPQVTKVTAVDNRPPEELAGRPAYDKLTAITPECWLRLETSAEQRTTRVIDLVAPVGKGQRGLIVAPPRSGKTVLLQHIGQAVAANHPEVELVVLLIDERPEEVTEMRRRIPGQVFASSLDREVENHVRLAQLVVERCKRLAEQGKDVFLLIDSITRMARAFNKWVGNSGRTMSGGVDIKALDIPKKLFASARAFEEGGSLTILATALVETGSRMDDLIYEEFKGTGNMELVLDRRLADRRIWPALDISRSGARREEKLFDPSTLDATTSLRRALSSMHPAEAMEQLIAQLARHGSNREFLHKIRERAARAA